MTEILFLFLCPVAAYLAWKLLARALKADKAAFDREVKAMEHRRSSVTVVTYRKGK